MRIAFVHYQDPTDENVWNGTPAYLIGRLREAGHEVIVVGPLHGKFPLFAHVVSHVRRKFYKIVYNKTFYVHRDPNVSRARGRYASRIIAKIPNLDAVLCVVPSDAAYIQSLIPLFLLFDSTWHQCLDFYPDCMRKDLAQATIDGGLEIDKATYSNCTKVIYSSAWATESAKLDYGAPQEKLAVLSLGANLNNTPTLEKVKQILQERGQNPCRLLFIGREWRRKGGDIALEITSNLIAMGVSCELHIVGCNVPDPVPEYVVAHGFLNKKNPPDMKKLNQLFSNCDFFLCPTRVDCQPMVIAEAAAYGLPVVTTNIAGIPEIVPKSNWGITLPVHASPSEYAKWIRSLYQDRERYDRACIEAKEYYAQHLSNIRLSENLISLIFPYVKIRG